MNFIVYLGFLVSCLFPLVIICNVNGQIPEPELQALRAFYNACNGDEWFENRGFFNTYTSLTLSGWQYGRNPCRFYGVSCANGHVIEVKCLLHNMIRLQMVWGILGIIYSANNWYE